MSRYQIWNKTDSIITPIGEVLTAEQWMNRYPMAQLPDIKLVIGGGTINGAVCMEFSTMLDNYSALGVDFSTATTDQEKLDLIEAFEDTQNQPIDNTESSAEERIAAALELSNLLQMETVNYDDPDE